MESSSVIASNCIDPKVSDDTINIDFSDEAFFAILNNIKAENVSFPFVIHTHIKILNTIIYWIIVFFYRNLQIQN